MTSSARRLMRVAAVLTLLTPGLPRYAVAQAATPPTFSHDIAPILFRSCVPCHRDSGPGPFPLTTYREVRQRATLVATATASRYMPPWKAEPDGGPFVGQHLLTPGEIDAIDRWVRTGAVEGDPRETPPVPRLPEGWLLGKPDLEVTLPEPFILQPLPSDVFRIFAIRIPVTKRTWVRGIEFHPGNARVVHHANIRVDRTSATRLLDEADPLPGYEGLMPRSAEYPRGHFLGWTPGQVAPLVSPDLAWPLEPGSDLVVQLHLQPSGAVERVQPTIGFYFSDEPPTRIPTVLRLGSQSIAIAPGEARYVIHDAYTLPVDVDLLALQPHAHYRARDIRGIATLPDGSVRTLIHIPDWDFRWQHVYRLEKPVRLPRGTRLEMSFSYDNSDANARNPVLPPTQVWWGQRSRDEMGDLWFQMVATTNRDRALIDAEVQQKMTAEDVLGYETMLRAAPNDVELHDDVAVLYLGMNRAEDAVRHFQASAALQPASAAAQFNLGTALMMSGRAEDAVTALRAATTRRPDYALARNNLGRALLMEGRTGEAIAELQEAARLDRTDTSTLFNLSEAYASAGFYQLAVNTAEQLLARQPSAVLAQQVRERLRQYRQKLDSGDRASAPRPGASVP